jgi:hypothetical protein
LEYREGFVEESRRRQMNPSPSAQPSGGKPDIGMRLRLVQATHEVDGDVKPLPALD